MGPVEQSEPAARRGVGVPEVPPGLDRAAALAWRTLVVGAALLALVWVLARLQVVVLPVFAALVVATVLVPPVSWLRRRGLPAGLATAAAFLAAGLVVAGLFALVVPPLAAQGTDLRETLDDALTDVERWIVEDGPGDVTEQDVEDAEQAVADAAQQAAERSGQQALLDGARIAAEVLAGLLLALVVSFFLVKDGPQIQRWVLGQTPEHRRALLRRLAGRAWWTLGGYVRGTFIFGVVEAAIFAVALLLLGADLVLPVAALALVAPFLPIVGAVISGIVAVLVVLVTAGTVEAVIMLVVAVLVQQLDGDVLNPLIYGRTVQLHPLVILVVLTAGVALGGLIGAVLAVPVAAVVINVVGEYRALAAEAAQAREPASAPPP